jgi:hypothetical protein
MHFFETDFLLPFSVGFFLVAFIGFISFLAKIIGYKGIFMHFLAYLGYCLMLLWAYNIYGWGDTIDKGHGVIMCFLIPLCMLLHSIIGLICLSFDPKYKR